MNKKLLITMSIVISTVIILCGCPEQKALSKDEEKNQIKLQSNIVELYDSTFNVNTKLIQDDDTHEFYEIVDNIEVKYLFKNIAGKPINISISAEFYDKNDKLIAIGGPRSISLPEDHTERAYTIQNSIIYNGYNAADVEYVLLVVEEKVV